MEKLWAPWRMELIEQPQAQGGCIFCDLPKSKDDAKNLVLGRTARTFAMLNKFPYNNGHLMVIPRAHVAEPSLLSVEQNAALAELLRRTTSILKEALGAHGFNIGMNLGRVAGAGIDQHCHWHIVPRWNGDTNFMPVVGDVKVLSEHLLGTWDRLQPYFSK